MRKYKVIAVVDGIVHLTKEELETLLDEAYQDGYEEAKNKYQQSLWPAGVRQIDTAPTIGGTTVLLGDDGPKLKLTDDSIQKTICDENIKSR